MAHTIQTTRWSPFQEVLTLREAMNQLFDESVVSSSAARRAQGFVPALDLSETSDAYLIEVAVPGLKASELDVAIEQGQLTIKGEIKQQKEEQKRSYHRIERQYGVFSRTISLPASVRADAIVAELKDGILYLEVPKAEIVKPRKVSISIANQPVEANNN